MMGQISPLIAFGAGLLSFLSPCVLPLVPVYLGSLSGPEIFESGVTRRRLPMFFHSLSFVIGFSIVFVTLGAIAGLIGFAISPNQALLHKIAGGLLIAFGMFMLAAMKLPWLNYEKRLNLTLGSTTGYLRSFFIGAILPLAWTACVGPILSGILALAGSSGTVWRGAYLLAIYSMGLGLPFLIIGAAFSSIAPLLKYIHRYSSLVYIISGLLLIAIGVLILTNRLTWLYSITA